MFNLVLFGPPGSGKGTQSENIIKTYNLLHLSTGDLLREEVTNQTPLGIEAQKYMNNGMLVPDEVVIGMISSKLDENSEARGFVFDGFPRTRQQAEALDKLLEFKNAPIDLVISLEVPEQQLIKRLTGRGQTSGRTDDTEDVIVKRIAEYKLKTEPVATYYNSQGKLTTIAGEHGIDETFKQICRIIGTRL